MGFFTCSLSNTQLSAWAHTSCSVTKNYDTKTSINSHLIKPCPLTEPMNISWFKMRVIGLFNYAVSVLMLFIFEIRMCFNICLFPVKCVLRHIQVLIEKIRVNVILHCQSSWSTLRILTEFTVLHGRFLSLIKIIVNEIWKLEFVKAHDCTAKYSVFCDITLCNALKANRG
jgi:hypothetical protein